MSKRKLLVYQPIIGPYRIDLFNALNESFTMRCMLGRRNLKSQTFDYEKVIASKFHFEPIYMREQGRKRRIEFIKEIRRFKPDIVMTCEYGTMTLTALLYKYLTFKKYKVVTMTDDSYDMLMNNNNFTKKHKIAAKILNRFLSNIVVVEPRIEQIYQRKYGKGIYFPIIKDDEIARKEYESCLGISEQYVKDYDLLGKKVLLFVGRLVALKNIDFVINTFKQIEGENLRFVIVGGGVEQQNLQRIAEGDSRIFFTGRLEGETVDAWYNLANAFVLASYREPFGAVTNEALLGGCFSLISKNAGSNCLVSDGKNGYVIDPYDAEDLKQKLELTFNASTPISSGLTLRDSLMIENFKECYTYLETKLNETLEK